MFKITKKTSTALFALAITFGVVLYCIDYIAFKKRLA